MPGTTEFSHLPTTTSRSGLAYRRGGAGRHVLLLHGIPGSAATWFASAQLLAQRCDVIVPDLLGFGASARPATFGGVCITAQAVALSDLMAELDLRAVVVVGHDFGGPIAVSLATSDRTRVTALGLLAANVRTDTPIPFPLSTVGWPVLGRVARRVLFSGISQMMMLRQGTADSANRPPRSTHLGDRRQRRTVARIFSESLTRIGEIYRPIEDALGELSIPRAVGWGDSDPFLPIEQGERVAAALDVAVERFTRTGHFIPHERPSETAEFVLGLAGLSHVPTGGGHDHVH